MEKLKLIMNKYEPDSIIVGFKDNQPKEIIKGSWYTITNFPNSLNQVIKDYIECHYTVLTEDQYSIIFKTKQDENKTTKKS